MNTEADRLGSAFPDRELASASTHSELGESTWGPCELVSTALWPIGSCLAIWHGRSSDGYSLEPNSSLYDISHNTCKMEEHTLGGRLGGIFLNFTERVRRVPADE